MRRARTLTSPYYGPGSAVLLVFVRRNTCRREQVHSRRQRIRHGENRPPPPEHRSQNRLGPIVFSMRRFRGRSAGISTGPLPASVNTAWAFSAVAHNNKRLASPLLSPLCWALDGSVLCAGCIRFTSGAYYALFQAFCFCFFRGSGLFGHPKTERPSACGRVSGKRLSSLQHPIDETGSQQKPLNAAPNYTQFHFGFLSAAERSLCQFERGPKRTGNT